MSDELHSHLQVGLEDGLAQTFLRHTCVGVVGCRANLAVSLPECDGGGLLIVADPIESVDAVVVLSGGTGDRLALAIEMLENGYTENLVITDTNLAANDRLRVDELKGGFKRESIFITDLPVESTYEEALAVGDFALIQGWDRLMIGTDPYHSFRTRYIFRRELQENDIEVFVRSVAGHWFRSSTWFYRKEGW